MKKILLAILPIALSVSCSKVSGFDTPDTAALAAEQVAKAKAFSGRTISYEALRAKATTSFATYEENDAFEGYVISSDEGGNFYKKIYVQAADKSGTIAVSIDKKGKMTDSKVSDKTEKTSDDIDAYDLIMKNKELLLDRDPKNSPVRFIFSHSALREGWDNPNVFQICTLKQSSSDVRKRQEVGRGASLSGQVMDRMYRVVGRLLCARRPWGTCGTSTHRWRSP